MEQVLEVVAYINSADLQANVFVASLRWLFLMLSAFFLTVMLYTMMTSPTWHMVNFLVDAREFLSTQPANLRRIGKKWRKIMARLETGNEAEYKLAIIEADGILTETLEKMDVDGETTEQRLRNITTIILPNVDEVMQVHEIRNSVVYDPDYRLSQSDTRRVLEVYATAFKTLDLMS